MIRKLIARIRAFFTRCDRCNCRGATRQRQNTAYHDDKLNWATYCPTCQEEANEYWDERWREYHSSIL